LITRFSLTANTLQRKSDLCAHRKETACTDKKDKEIFIIYNEIQVRSVAKSYMRKGFLIYEEMRKYLTIFVEAVSLM
jgi:hypothetical protein